MGISGAAAFAAAAALRKNAKRPRNEGARTSGVTHR
jgi:hypothetical protein